MLAARPLFRPFEALGRRDFADGPLPTMTGGSIVVKTLIRAAAAVVLVGALSSPAMARPHHHAVPPPITTIHIHGGSVGFIVGVGGADGYVVFHGARYPIEVSGLKIGTIGVSSYELDGRVYNIRRIEDIEGDYSAGEASATAGAGAGDIDMANGRGVEIRASSSSAGLQLTLGGGGATIRLKR
jgi:hypothetical protein